MELFQINGFVVTEYRENQSQAQGGFSGCDRDCEKGKQRPVHQSWIRAEVPESNQVEVARIQHDLETDKHYDDMPARERTHQPDREQDG